MLSAMATGNDFPIFWNSGFQLFLQHDFYVSVLPYAGRRFIPRTHRRLCNDVHLWRNLYDCILTLLQDQILGFHAFLSHREKIEKYCTTAM
jgi:hypothetical protein